MVMLNGLLARCQVSSWEKQAYVSHLKPGTRWQVTKTTTNHPQLNPFTTAVPFWGQSARILSNLSPNRDCGSKRVKHHHHRQLSTSSTTSEWWWWWWLWLPLLVGSWWWLSSPFAVCSLENQVPGARDDHPHFCCCPRLEWGYCVCSCCATLIPSDFCLFLFYLHKLFVVLLMCVLLILLAYGIHRNSTCAVSVPH